MNATPACWTLLGLTVFLSSRDLPGQRRPERGGGTALWSFLAAKYDVDGNGAITAAEYDRGAEKFASYDRDRNGVITAADFAVAPARGRRPGPRPVATTAQLVAAAVARKADEGGDGRVTPAEWRKAASALDRDGDGVLTAAELQKILAEALGRKALSLRAAGRRLRHFDTDRDGVVQAGEFTALFARLDRDGDRMLGGTELAGLGAAIRTGPPRVGELAPDFDLPTVDDPKRTVRLSSFRGKKPVALIFGSYT